MIYGIFALIFFFLLIFFLTLEIEIKLIVKGGENHSFLILRILKGLIRLRLNLSIHKDKESLFGLTLRKTDSSLSKKTSLEEVFQFIQKSLTKTRNFRGIIQYVISKARVTNFSLIFRFGIEDAAATALLTGLFYILFSVLLQSLRSSHKVSRQKLSVVPVFQGNRFDLDLDCIIAVRIGYIIIAGAKMAIYLIKGGESSGRASN